MKKIVSEFIEVELRVTESFYDKIADKYNIKPSCSLYIKDSYLEFCKKTGNLRRLRKYTHEQTKESFFLISEKTAFEDFFIETKRDISEKEFHERLSASQNNIVGEVEGRRIKIPYNGLIFCFDSVKYLGDFTEFEIKVQEKAEISAAETKIKETMKELGISEEDVLQKTYPELLIEKGRWKID